jgi:hypothetical protein
MTNKFYLSEKLNDSKIQSVLLCASAIGVNPSWLMCVFHFETAGTLDPKKTNSIGSVGLIQFTRDKKGEDFKTINGKKYSLAYIKNLTFEKQMLLVTDYLKPYSGKIKSFTDLYLAVFFPLAIGKDDNFTLQTKNLTASLIAKQNPIFDQNKDAKLTKNEVTSYFANRYKTVWNIINVPLLPDFLKPKLSIKNILTIVIPVVLFFLLLVYYNPLKRK